MKRLLIHGCFDAITLQNLKEFNAYGVSFDLRSSSPNLVTFRELISFIPKMGLGAIHLTFANDKPETIHSYLDLLKNFSQEKILHFRDQREASFYESFNVPFVWMFNPDGDWKNIIKSKNLRSLLLPVEWRPLYKTMPLLWDTIEEYSVDVFLHVKNFNEIKDVDSVELHLSIDLTGEIESSYRLVDQERLKKMKVWSAHASTSF